MDEGAWQGGDQSIRQLGARDLLFTLALGARRAGRSRAIATVVFLAQCD